MNCTVRIGELYVGKHTDEWGRVTPILLTDPPGRRECLPIALARDVATCTGGTLLRIVKTAAISTAPLPPVRAPRPGQSRPA